MRPLLGGAQVWGFVMLAPRVALLTWWVGGEGISLSLEELGHQLEGLSTALSSPQAPTCQLSRSVSGPSESKI